MGGTVETSVMDNVQRLLEGLKKTSDGAIMYKLVERALHRFSGSSGRVELAFVAFLHKLLDNYAGTPGADPVTRMKAKLLQQRLIPFLPPEDAPGPSLRPVNPAPPLRRRTATSAAPRPAAPDADSARVPPDAVVPRASTAPPAAAPAEPPPTLVEDSAAPIAGTSAPAGGEHDEVDVLQLKVAHNVADIISRNRAFDTLLRQSLDTLQKSDASEEIDDLKQVLVKGIEELINGQRHLGEKLFTTTSYLNAIHTDRRRLRDALSSARKHSLADELTGLPNRAAFVRQLNGEIGRARRYGFSLVVAIIDVDDLKSVNELYGRTTGDAVLQCYTNEIMSQFRGYDMVARYGDDEFAVLFPNTQKEGATHALEKARKRAAETYITHAGKSIPLPSFSSVLTLYSPGEKPATILQRAGEALDHAKSRGYNQMVVALPGT